MTPADQVYNYHYNAVGSTVAVTDQSQAMVNKYAYDAFGAVANQVEAIPQPFTYVGQFGVMREPNGFYYMKARYYDSTVGRFVSEDPIGFAGGDVNVSAYVGGNPISKIDPMGLMDNFLPQIPGFSDRFPDSRVAAVADIVSGGIELGGAIAAGTASLISYSAGPEFWPVSILASGASLEAGWDGVNRIYSGVTKLNDLSANPVWTYQYKSTASSPKAMKCH